MMHESFKTMSKFLKENAEEWHQPEADWAYCWGKIKNCRFRCFQEINYGVPSAYVVIQHNVSEGASSWPAFYSAEEVQAWLDSL
jgi:hypothetical protein